MKAAIRKVLAGFGLATAAQLAHAQAQARQAADKAEQRLAKLRADADGWKQRQEEAARSAAELRKTAARADTAAERAARDLERANARTEEWKGRAETLTAEMRELRQRLEETRRVTTVARQHLMATEVKLDLIEAAIQVLDARTRERSLPRP
jgi:chromosome segregation ATPase